MTKIDIISGFLGSGKTTLIKKFLDNDVDFGKVVIIENEFGEVGIDGSILKESGIDVIELNSGCICCSIVGDFSRSLKEILEKYNPDRIIIEPSGVGKLSDVLSSILKIEKSYNVKINSLICVVNAQKFQRQLKGFGAFFRNQITYANFIILSRTQLMEQESISDCKLELEEINPLASIVDVSWDMLSSADLLNIFDRGQLIAEKISEELYKEINNEKVAHNHSKDRIFKSWGTEINKVFTQRQIESILKQLAMDEEMETLRAKGILQISQEKWINFDFVLGEYDIKYTNSCDIGKVCVIGTSLNTTKLESMFGVAID